MRTLPYVQSLVNDLDETLTKQGFDIAGSLLYTCGVIAYYDNDVIEAKAYLDRAALRRAADHDGELTTNDDYRNRFAFIHYFRALIQKNWGELSEAQYEIQQSVRLLENKAGEYLAPVTRAEILSYIPGDEERCRGELMALIQRLNELADSLKKDGASLDANQRRLRNRMLVLCGNTYFEQKEFSKALEQYGKAIEFNANDYYALVSAAQCERTLGDSEGAAIHFGQTLEAIDRSGDLGRKREQITRAVIAVIASIAAKEIDDRANCERYTREAREVLRGNLTVDGLSPKFFSPATKRLVSASELLKMLEV